MKISKKFTYIAASVTLASAIATVTMMLNVPNAAANNGQNPVGSWFVTASDAPFSYHMFSFHSDGTMQQANPEFGDADTSDSDGLGVWVKDGTKIKGKFGEITADRTTHAFVNRGEISFEFTVNGDTFSGTATANFYDVNGKLVRGPLPTPLEGKRVTLP